MLVDNVRVRSVGKNQTINQLPIGWSQQGEKPVEIKKTPVYFVVEGGQAKSLETPVYDLEALKGGMKIEGPSIILN